MIPHYDKSAHGGKGDRFPLMDQTDINYTKPTLLLVEGWMLAFKPFTEDSKESREFFEKYPGMEEVNEKLKEYESLWESYFDGRILVEVENTDVVF